MGVLVRHAVLPDEVECRAGEVLPTGHEVGSELVETEVGIGEGEALPVGRVGLVVEVVAEVVVEGRRALREVARLGVGGQGEAVVAGDGGEGGAVELDGDIGREVDLDLEGEAISALRHACDDVGGRGVGGPFEGGVGDVLRLVLVPGVVELAGEVEVVAHAPREAGGEGVVAVALEVVVAVVFEGEHEAPGLVGVELEGGEEIGSEAHVGAPAEEAAVEFPPAEGLLDVPLEAVHGHALPSDGGRVAEGCAAVVPHVLLA